MSATRIKPLDGVQVAGTGVQTIGTGTIGDYTQDTSAPMYINVFVTGSGNAYLQSAGSTNAGDGRYVASGGSAQYGPVSYADFPQIRFDAASGAWVSFDVLVSEG
jgi:hypothetical protein